jgi:protein gp37
MAVSLERGDIPESVDLFHSEISNGYIDRVFEVMERIDRHTYQILTKRPERMRRYLKHRYLARRPPANVWLGVSVESNAYAWRVEMLRECPAALRFLSMEPLIGPVDAVRLEDIGWVIVGGESGPGRRLIDPEWVRDVRNRCQMRGVPFFFKQWHKAGTGRELDGRTWDEMPAMK